MEGFFMDFMQSETRINLARAFAGESQARNRYTIYADIARKEGQEYLARIFQETADNEKVHGEEFLEMIQKHAPAPQENIHIDAGYPFPLGSTAQNLAFAAAGELEEFTTAYPAFAELAKREGFQDVARLFEQIATIEGLHHNVFQQAHSQLTGGTLYQKPQPIVWRCLNCGYSYVAEKPYAKCPVCQKDQGWAEGDIDNKQLPSKQQKKEQNA
jgi:rubrerythrin